MIQQPEGTTSTVTPIELYEVYHGDFSVSLVSPSATAIRNTGVAFKSVYPSSSYMDITFDKENKILTLPKIFINKESKSRFLNLMVFEKFQPHRGQEVSAYIDFMDSLIHSAKDVRLLRKKSIIIFEGRKDEEVAAFFHELAKSQIANPDDSLNKVRLSLGHHYIMNHDSRKTMVAKCGSIFQEWGQDFGDTYCKTPWAFIGLVAGFIILLLTAMQTFYSGAPFYKN